MANNATDESPSLSYISSSSSPPWSPVHNSSRARHSMWQRREHCKPSWVSGSPSLCLSLRLPCSIAWCGTLSACSFQSHHFLQPQIYVLSAGIASVLLHASNSIVCAGLHAVRRRCQRAKVCCPYHCLIALHFVQTLTLLIKRCSLFHCLH
jgi:hypothetical protein